MTALSARSFHQILNAWAALGINPESFGAGAALAGRDYINIHTAANPDVEIRGQLTK
jgi:hypothetical protein